MDMNNWHCDGPSCNEITKADNSSWWHIIEYKGWSKKSEVHFCSDKCRRNHTLEKYDIKTESNELANEHVGGYRTLFGLLKK